MTRLLEILFHFRPGELAGADSWRPRLVGVPASSWGVLLVAMIAAALIWLTVRSYRREGATPPRAKLTLAGLRIAIIMLTLAILLQPVLTLKNVRTDYSTVLVLLDDSLSMSIGDGYADPDRRAAMAKALGVSPDALPGLSRAEIVRRLLAPVSDAASPQDSPAMTLAENHPLWLMAFSTSQPQQEGYTRPLATLEKVELRPTVEPPSRDGILAATLLAGVVGVWLAVLVVLLGIGVVRKREATDGQRVRGPSAVLIVTGALAVLVLLTAGTYAVRADRIRIDAMLQPPQPPPEVVDVQAAVVEATAPLTGRGYETNLVRAVREAMEKARGRRLAAVVIISDGQSTSGAGPTAMNGVRLYAQQRGVGLLAVGVGDDTPPRNIRVVSLAIPPQVRVGGTVPGEVTIEARNLVESRVVASILRQRVGEDGWVDTGTRVEVDLPPVTDEIGQTSARGAARFDLTVDAVGEYVYKAQVAPGAWESLKNDNEAAARVTATDEKIRLLLVSGDAGWEFQYLRNYLLRNPHKYLVSVWQQNAAGGFSQESSPGMFLPSLPATLEGLVDAYDVVVL
jgi:hypothetical protein